MKYIEQCVSGMDRVVQPNIHGFGRFQSISMSLKPTVPH